MRYTPIVLIVSLIAAFMASVPGCSSDGPADTGFDAGIDAGFDAGFDAGWDGGAPCGNDAGACPVGYHCDQATNGCAPGCVADTDCAKYQTCIKTSGKCEDQPTTASITVDTNAGPGNVSELINASGMEVENNADGHAAELFADRGFEWDRSHPVWGTDPWTVKSTDPDNAKASIEWVSTPAYQGAHAFKLTMTQAFMNELAGIGQEGLGLQGGREYTFSFMSYDDGNRPQNAYAVLFDGDSDEIIGGPVEISMWENNKEWTYHGANITPTRSSKSGIAALMVSKVSSFWVDSLSLRPKNAKAGVWPELIQAYKEAGISAIRLGGTSADGYDWRDGVGPSNGSNARDARPVRKPALADTSLDPGHTLQYTPYYNDIGTDEFLDFCKEVGAEPLLTVSFPLGAQAAANWVEYVNGTSPGIEQGILNGWKTTSWKSTEKAPDGYFAWLRDLFGHNQGWGVKYWEIGNQIWDEELPEPGSLKGQPNLDNYAVKALEFAAAMKAVPFSTPIMVAANSSPLPIPAGPDYRHKWNSAVLDAAGSTIDFLAPHFYAPGDFDPSGMAPEVIYESFAGVGPYYGIDLAQVQSDIGNWKNKSGSTRDVLIATTEYNVSNGVYEYKDACGSNRLRSVIGTASFKNVNMRGPAAIAFQNSLSGGPHGMLDWGAESKALGTPLKNGGYILQELYSDHFQAQILPVNVIAADYEASYGGRTPVTGTVLDVVAAADATGKTMSLFVVNRNYWPGSILTKIKTGGFEGKTAKAFILTGSTPESCNTILKPQEISVTEEDIGAVGTEFKYAFMPNSVTVVEITK